MLTQPTQLDLRTSERSMPGSWALAKALLQRELVAHEQDGTLPNEERLDCLREGTIGAVNQLMAWALDALNLSKLPLVGRALHFQIGRGSASVAPELSPAPPSASCS